jgi:hypothetical protein
MPAKAKEEYDSLSLQQNAMDDSSVLLLDKLSLSLLDESFPVTSLTTRTIDTSPVDSSHELTSKRLRRTKEDVFDSRSSPLQKRRTLSATNTNVYREKTRYNFETKTYYYRFPSSGIFFEHWLVVYQEVRPGFFRCVHAWGRVVALSRNRRSKGSWKEQRQTVDVIIKSEVSCGRGWDTIMSAARFQIAGLRGNDETNLTRV